MMKKMISAAIAAWTVMALTVGAQTKNNDSKDWKEKVQKEKIEYIVKEMGLTAAEKEAFLPVYNMAQQEKQDKFEAAMTAYKALEEAVSAKKSEKEIGDLLTAYLKAEEESQEVDEEYVSKYRKVLSATKTAKLYLAEEKFRRDQIHRLHRGDGPGNPPPGRPGDRRGKPKDGDKK